MRLRQIRISGFKSFADLTTIDIPSSLVGIVGPNGCGKSNVIEAVQWAMGEGKASDLRCKTMGELIFAGSDQRRQAARAMVELIFDNSDQTLKGPWGTYSEISVKRVLTRENTSSYLINNQQVRASDVRDLFMGTGLGANSYAIISQGMITEFAKDSPEKRREYLEEAAGVSKYKKRRKEAESRLQTTRNNLDRVQDLQITRRENLQRLQAEAEVAQHWQQLDNRRKAQEALWWYLQKVTAEQNVEQMNVSIGESQARLQEQEAQLNGLKNKIDLAREEQENCARDVLENTQKLAQIDKTISQLQGNIRAVIEKRSLMQAQIESYEHLIGVRREQRQAALEQAQLLQESLEDVQARLEGAQEHEAVLQTAFDQASETAQTRRVQSDEASRQASDRERESMRLSADIARLSDTKQMLSARVQKLRTEASEHEAPDMQRLAMLEEEHEQIQAQLQEALAEKEQAQEEHQAAQQAYEASRQELLESEKQSAAVSARLHALRELQEKAEAGDRLTAWLKEQGLDGLKQLYQYLTIDSQWAGAVEAVLREKVRALGVSRLQMVSAFDRLPPPAKLSFYNNTLTLKIAQSVPGLTPLMDKITIEEADEPVKALLQRWLAGVYVASSVSEALEQVTNLPEGAVFVTEHGHTIDAQSVTYWAEDESSGHLARLAEIHDLQEKTQGLREALEAAQSRSGQALQAVQQTRQSQEHWAGVIEQLRGLEQRTAVELTRLKSAKEAWEHRSNELSAWIEEAQESLAEVVEDLAAADERFSELDEVLAQVQEEAAQKQLAFEAARDLMIEAQQKLQAFDYSMRELSVKATGLQERLQAGQKAQEASLKEEAELLKKVQLTSEQLQTLTESSDNEELKGLLHEQAKAQEELLGVKTLAEIIGTQLHKMTEQMFEAEQARHIHQSKIGELTVRRQQYDVQLATVNSRLDEIVYDPEALNLRIEAEKPKLNTLKNEIDRLARDLKNMGAVNHAALVQLQEETAQVERIDQEVLDLQKAIATIEAAITRIDSETRSVLMQTFNRVNAAFNEKFVQLFKGGHAKLVMTSEDALQAGIEMYANPPGKHNHSIRQLSGGELTLTATALVFAFFTLNPAPFCLLDEVDAPLDEANQERLCRLVNAMSANTQFMMITHHRVTMEHTNQLIGVTMKEPGVSRIVSVDIQEASQYIQTKGQGVEK